MPHAQAERLTVAVLALAVALNVAAAPHLPIAGGVGPDGWTVLQPSRDSTVVFVSSSTGNDANDGLRREAPVRTLARGMELLRDGYPDWLLLRRGDVWYEPLVLKGKSGRSAAEPLVISSYGASGPRPLLKTGSFTTAFEQTGNAQNVALVGIHFYAHNRDPDSAEFRGLDDFEGESLGIWWLGGGGNFLVEDCVVQRYRFGVSVQGFRDATVRNFQLRRCQVLDSTGWEDGHSSGVYVHQADGVLIEECLIDRNGWNLQADGSGPKQTILTHNIYVQSSNANVVLHGNIIARASSHGAQMRSGGVVAGNLFVRNPLCLLIGGGDHPAQGGVTAEVTGNAFLEANDIGKSPRGYGVEFNNIRSATFSGNILAHDASVAPYGRAVNVRAGGYGGGIGSRNITIEGNTIFDWRGGINFYVIGSLDDISDIRVARNLLQSSHRESLLVGVALHRDASGDIDSPRIFQELGFSGNVYRGARSPIWFKVHKEGGRAEPMTFEQWVVRSGETDARAARVEFVDPDRSPATYHGALGKEATLEAFLAEARRQSRSTWRDEYTAASVVQYIREGFRPLDGTEPE